jgi:hypothetical protein
MSTQRCLVGSLVGGIVLFFLGYAIFGVLLAGFFEANRGSATGVNRESIDFVALAIGQLMWGAGLTTVLMWKGASTAMDGLKIGATVGLLFFLGFDLTMYATTHLSNLIAALVDALAATALFAVTGAVITLVTAPRR